MDPRKRTRAAPAATLPPQPLPQQQAPPAPVPAATHAAHNAPSGAVLASQPPGSSEPSDPRQRNKRARQQGQNNGATEPSNALASPQTGSTSRAVQQPAPNASHGGSAPVKPASQRQRSAGASAPAIAKPQQAKAAPAIDVHPTDLEAGHPYLQPRQEHFELRNITFVPTQDTVLDCEAAFLKPQTGTVQSIIALIGVSIYALVQSHQHTCCTGTSQVAT